MQSKSIRWVIF